MGQSQSLIEKNKTQPIKPTKIFGFIFFQRFYNEVVVSKRDLALQHMVRESLDTSKLDEWLADEIN